jgi:hypothetical protein
MLLFFVILFVFVGVHSWLGQACSKSSILFTVLTVLAISYYNLWNKGVFYIHKEHQCTFVSEFNAQLVYKIENCILLIVYSIVLTLSVILLFIFMKKKNKLRCNVNRDRQREKDMLFTLVIVALLTSAMRLAFFFNSLIQINNSLENIETIFLQSSVTYEQSINTDLMRNIDKLTTQYSNSASLFQFNIELLLFLSSSFKIITFLLCMKTLRSKLTRCMRIRFIINSSVLCTIFKRQNQHKVKICTFKGLHYPSVTNKSLSSTGVIRSNV